MSNNREYLKVLLVSEAQLKQDSVIQKNVGGKILSATLKKVQDEKLKPILGAEFYDTILQESYNKATQTGYVLSDSIIELLAEYIQPYLIHATVAECVETLEFRFTNKGIKKLNDDNASNLSPIELSNVKNKFNLAAVDYKSALIKYLKANGLASGMTDDDITFEATGWDLSNGGSSCGNGVTKAGGLWSGKGWSADFRDEECNGKIIRKLIGYFGGEGEMPTLNVGMYVGQNSYVSSCEDALDFRAQGADKHFEFEQVVAATEWNINHQLGKKVSVSVVDTADSLIVCEVRYIDNNNVKLLFTSPVSGKAYLN